MQPLMEDASTNITQALPNGAATVDATAIDLGNPTGKDFIAEGVEFELSAPALVVGDLANAATMTYALQHSDDNSSFSVLQASFLVQTGADGAGAAAATKRFKPDADVKRYLRVSATNSGAGDASDKSLTFKAKY